MYKSKGKDIMKWHGTWEADYLNVVNDVVAPNQWVSNGNDIYYNDGNVGIGTTSPAELLNVDGNILIGSGAGDGGYIKPFTHGLQFYGDDNNQQMSVYDNQVYIVTKLGIGASTVDEMLHVEAASGDPSIKLENTGNDGGDLIIQAPDGAKRIDFNDATGNIMTLTTDTNRVGIGTTSPASKLDVNGTVSAAALSAAGTVSAATLSVSSGAIVADNDASGAAVIRNILVGTEATPGPANLYPQGTIYLKYTA